MPITLMKTKLIMAASALILGAAGAALTFAPAEILRTFGVGGNPLLTFAFQITGALFLGFAMLNWMAKESTIGGIYNRPLAAGNFMHFFVGALALIKGVMAGHTQSAVWIAAAIYAVFAVCFGWILFGKRS